MKKQIPYPSEAEIKRENKLIAIAIKEGNFAPLRKAIERTKPKPKPAKKVMKIKVKRKPIKRKEIDGLDLNLPYVWDDGHVHFFEKLEEREITMEDVDLLVNGSTITLNIKTGVDEKSGEIKKRVVGYSLDFRIIAVGYTIRGEGIRLATAFPANDPLKKKFLKHYEDRINEII